MKPFMSQNPELKIPGLSRESSLTVKKSPKSLVFKNITLGKISMLHKILTSIKEFSEL